MTHGEACRAIAALLGKTEFTIVREDVCSVPSRHDYRCERCQADQFLGFECTTTFALKIGYRERHQGNKTLAGLVAAVEASIKAAKTEPREQLDEDSTDEPIESAEAIQARADALPL